jgi:hypothetical protein
MYIKYNKKKLSVERNTYVFSLNLKLLLGYMFQLFTSHHQAKKHMRMNNLYPLHNIHGMISRRKMGWLGRLGRMKETSQK